MLDLINEGLLAFPSEPRLNMLVSSGPNSTELTAAS